MVHDKLAANRGVILVVIQNVFVDFFLFILAVRFQPLDEAFKNDQLFLALGRQMLQSAVLVEEVVQHRGFTRRFFVFVLGRWERLADIQDRLSLKGKAFSFR